MSAEKQARIERLADSGHAEWDAFVAAHPNGTAAHLAFWGPLIKRLFGHSFFYFLARDDEGAICGVLPVVQLRSLLFGNYMVSVPYLNNGGALAVSASVQMLLMKAAESHAQAAGCSHVEYRNDSALAGDAATDWQLRDEKVAMELRLPDSEDALSKALGAKLRSQIRRPVKEGAVALRGGVELLEDFYAVFARNMRDLGTPVYSRRLFAAILEAMPGRAELVVVKVDNEPAAAGFVIGYKDRLEIPWASADRRYNRISVNMLLYWEVLRGAIASGYGMFDFGRSTRDSGTFKFKRQWGAEPRQLWWYYWLQGGGSMPSLNPSSAKYQLAIKMWQRLPMPIANTLGPHIVKNLP